MLTRKIFDFGADNGDPTFIRRVELENTSAEEERAEKLFRQSEDGRCLASTRGTIEEKVRKIRSVKCPLQ